MTAPAEDPRGGVAMRDPSLPCPVCGASGTQHCTTVSGRDHRRRNFLAPPRKPRPPAAGRGDTDSGGEDGREPRQCPRCGQMCTYDGWGHVHPDGLGIGSCRPAGDRAQPTQELREAIRWKLARRIGSSASACADDVLALPELAALLDAQAAVGRVEALEQTWRRRAVFHAEHGARETAVGLTHRANDLRRALDGTT